MLCRFDELKEVSIPHLNGGEGAVSAKMWMQPGVKMMRSTLPAGASIGPHAHTTSCEINYVLSGEGMAVCDGVEEPLAAGACHFCPVGSTHSIANTGSEPLVLFTAVPERQG